MLARALAGLEPSQDPNVLVGLNRADDAGVYRLSDELALVQTLDFFTPIVDDAYTFGRIAAVNALSDVYAMGAEPLTALNIVCFPSDSLPSELLGEILRGGGEACEEAGVAVLGGHSVKDSELKFGLSVTGRVHPKKLLTKHGARPGDRLILTKALGTGAVTTGIKRQQVSEAIAQACIDSMLQSNGPAACALSHFTVRAMTDITGFGLMGHAAEMLEGESLGLTFDSAALPLLPGAHDCAEAGVLPGGLARNHGFRDNMVDAEGVDGTLLNLMYDPQTSGGLLAAVDPAQANAALEALHKAGATAARVIGEVVAEPVGRIVVS